MGYIFLIKQKIGTKEQLDTNGKILFLNGDFRYASEPGMRGIEEAIQQMLASGVIRNNTAGIVIGSFINQDKGGYEPTEVEKAYISHLGERLQKALEQYGIKDMPIYVVDNKNKQQTFDYIPVQNITLPTEESGTIRFQTERIPNQSLFR